MISYDNQRSIGVNSLKNYAAQLGLDTAEFNMGALVKRLFALAKSNNLSSES